jgi:ferredoxin-nitrite reductase
VVSCTGIEFCSFALIETKSRALEIAAQLSSEHLQELPLVQPLRMHWSGCQHACSSHHIGDFGFQGSKVKQNGVMVDAVDIFVGGQIGRDSRLGTKIADRVPLTEVSAKIVELAREHLPGHFKPGFLEKRAKLQELQAADD